MAYIHQNTNELKRAIGFKVTRDKICPSLTFGLVDACKTIAGKVHKVNSIHLEEIDICCFPWLRRDFG